RSSRSRTRHRQRSHVWHGVGYRVPGENDSFGQNSIEFKPLLQKQLSRDFDIRWSAGEWLASIIISAPGFWRQTEAEIPGRGGGYGGQESKPYRISGRRPNASSSRCSDEHTQAGLVSITAGA